MRKDPIDKLLILPITRFINNSTTSGIVLFLSAITALILANSPLKDAYHLFWEHEFSIGYDHHIVSKTLHHWINDGLMAVFFFVIGLELKREVMAGELSKPKDAVLPLLAGLGGMFVPALVFIALNPTGTANDGWGIPMATDIAFALGIIYMLGDRVPLSLKIFLTALAIADDLGAVMVIALFYTSDVSTTSLVIGALFLLVLVGANLLGVRSTVFYGIVGIGGLWMAFLLSGIHATVAGVLAALTIPANVKISDKKYVTKIKDLTKKFEEAQPNNFSLVTKDQLYILERIRFYSKAAITPLQRLEHSMHPLVAFVVMPIFALANAGITFTGDFSDNLFSNVSMGIILGLVVGKFVGIVGISKLLVHFKLASLPAGATWKQMCGVALLAAVGFTMSLFITELAYSSPELILQAKIGVFIASIIGGLSGYFLLKKP
ncbi:MAG: Na+/H+ antiporter NhaA [Flavobacteriales bacterium]